MLNKSRILWIDDEVNILDSIQRILRRKPFELITCNNPIDALEFIKNQKFDIVVSDYCMPKMFGIVLLAEVAKYMPNSKRVILSGFVNLDIINKALEKGDIHAYIVKPWRNEAVLLLLNNLMPADC